MSVAQQADCVYALLADGTTIEIRPAVPADFDAVKAMYEAMSRDNIYLRFFSHPGWQRRRGRRRGGGRSGRAQS